MFHALEAATLKDRSPNLSLVRGRNKSRLDADRRTVDRDDKVETGCSRPVIYEGALPLVTMR